VADNEEEEISTDQGKDGDEVPKRLKDFDVDDEDPTRRLY
jgi:hypothetical protein